MTGHDSRSVFVSDSCVAAGLLVLTTVIASVWTFFALTRLSGIVTETVRQSESVTAVTSRLAGALEREDDAVLLILAGDDRGSQVLASERAVVDKAVDRLFDVLGPTMSASWRGRFKRSCTHIERLRTASSRSRRTRGARPIPPEGESGAASGRGADDRHP